MAAHPTAFQQPGGGERVALSLYEALKSHVDQVEMFDPWSTKLRDFDVLHYFSSIGGEHFPEWRKHVARLAVTPFIWPELPKWVALTRRARRAARRGMRRPVAGPYAAVDVLFPTSMREADLLVRNYAVPRNRVTVIPHGADLRFAEPATGTFAKTVGVPRFTLCPARIDQNKNQLRLVRALADMDLDLVILGDVAPGCESYAKACRAAAGPRTRFLPSLPHGSEELRDGFVTADCVVMPSEYELCSMAMLEAGVAGTPLASTTGGGMVQHLSPYAEFFNPRSETEIGRAVLAAIATGRRPGQSEHFATKFSWDEVARRTVEAYLRVT
ncbi:MAG TPA: glycosyltransferase family 4 protein [Solirubrobacteraceae bacterium]|nr:glycosyltransferase family 4 protein [Solirubrobacteraceae bacterium]